MEVSTCCSAMIPSTRRMAAYGTASRWHIRRCPQSSEETAALQANQYNTAQLTRLLGLAQGYTQVKYNVHLISCHLLQCINRQSIDCAIHATSSLRILQQGPTHNLHTLYLWWHHRHRLAASEATYSRRGAGRVLWISLLAGMCTWRGMHWSTWVIRVWAAAWKGKGQSQLMWSKHGSNADPKQHSCTLEKVPLYVKGLHGQGSHCALLPEYNVPSNDVYYSNTSW